MEIVQEYSDHGRSGLNIAGRDGLNQLMADVGAKRTTFTSLLVYDSEPPAPLSGRGRERLLRARPEMSRNPGSLLCGAV